MTEPSTLPPLFLYLYYYFMISTFITTLTVIFTVNDFKGFSLLNLVFVITIPWVVFVNNLGISHPNHPLYNLNALEILLYNLRQGDFESFYIVLGFLFILAWWFMFWVEIKNSKIKLRLRLVVVSSLLVGIMISFMAKVFNLSGWEPFLLAITGGGLYFFIFFMGIFALVGRNTDKS